MFVLASLVGCGIGKSSDLPETNPVANLPKGEVVPTAAMAALTQATLVVPAGVDADAALYKELNHIPPTLLMSETVLVM